MAKTPQTLKIGFVQQSCSNEYRQNLVATAAGISDAAAQGAAVVLLPELHAYPYFCQNEDPAYFDLSEPIPGPTTRTLSALARETGVVIVGSVFERRAAGIYHNTAVVIERDGTIGGVYRKMHIPDDPGYHEKFYFTPGDQGFEPITTSAGVLGVLVCWDQWYPEAARLMALKGADILLYPTAIGWDPNDDAEEKARQLDSWITVQRAHAIANGISLISCNRIGQEPDSQGRSTGITFWGNSFITGPQGEILAQAATDSAMVKVVEIDLTRMETVRQIWPFFRDRRIDAYSDLLKRYGRE